MLFFVFSKWSKCLLLKQHWIDRLDKHFVNRIHLQNNLYVDIYGHESLIKVTRHRFKPIFILHLHLKCCLCAQATVKPLKKKDKVNIQSLLDFASCPFNNFIPFILIHTFNSYTTIINQIANYKWFLRVYTKNKNLIWNAIAKPLHLRKKKHQNITSVEEIHQIQVSQIHKMGIMKQHYIDHFWLIVE